MFIYLTLSIPLIYLSVKSIIFHQKIKNHQKLTSKKWLFEDLSHNSMMGFNIMNVINMIFNLLIISHKNVTWILQAELLYAVLSVLLFVFVYISVDILPKRSVGKLAKEHSEYQLV